MEEHKGWRRKRKESRRDASFSSDADEDGDETEAEAEAGEYETVRYLSIITSNLSGGRKVWRSVGLTGLSYPILLPSYSTA